MSLFFLDNNIVVNTLATSLFWLVTHINETFLKGFKIKIDKDEDLLYLLIVLIFSYF